MLLTDIICLSDILPIVSSHLGIRDIKCIRATSKELSTTTNADARHMSMSETTAKYAHADLLENGAFRLKSRVGLHYADIRALPGIRRLHSTPLPIVSMMFRGVSFIGRVWAPGIRKDFIDAKIGAEYNIHQLFHPASSVLSAGNIWINKLEQIRPYDDGDAMLLKLELMLDRGFVAVDGGKFHLSVIFEPIFKNVIRQSDSHANNKRPLLLSNGAFRFHTLDGQMSADIRSIPGAPRLMSNYHDEDDYLSRPLLSMLYNGDRYVGREWGNGGRSFAALSESDGMFLPESTVLLDLAGGAWLSKLQHNVDNFHDGNLFTVLELTLDRGEQVEHGGVFSLRLLFTRI
jgi:hypothetical protein